MAKPINQIPLKKPFHHSMAKPINQITNPLTKTRPKHHFTTQWQKRLSKSHPNIHFLTQTEIFRKMQKNYLLKTKFLLFHKSKTKTILKKNQIPEISKKTKFN